MKKALIILLILVLAALCFIIYKSYLADEGRTILSGQVDADYIIVSSIIAGKIKSEDFSLGKEVKKDDVIIKLDSSLSELQVELAKANKASAPTKELKNVADVNIKIAEKQLEYATIKAPISGVVTEVYKHTSEIVGEGMPILKITDTKSPFVNLYIPADKLSEFKLGDKLELTSFSASNKVFSGEITFIAAEPEFTPKQIKTQDEKSRLVYKVKVSLTDSEGLLKPGIFIEAKQAEK